MPRPPLLFDDYNQTPPAEAWDLQVHPPATYIAWLEAQTPPGASEPIMSAATAYNIGARHAVLGVDGALPKVPNKTDYCGLSTAHPHVHVILSPVDTEGRPVTRADVERAGAAAWTRQTQRLIDYTSERLGLVWTPTGIERVDSSHIDDQTPCPGRWGLHNVVMACP